MQKARLLRKVFRRSPLYSTSLYFRLANAYEWYLDRNAVESWYAGARRGVPPKSIKHATVKALANLWTRYSFKNGALKGAWVGGGFNHTGKKAQRTNNPRLFLPSDTLWNAAVGYDWRWDHRAMNATVNWMNIGNEEYFPANQQRGMPGRAVLSLTAKF